MMPITKPNHSMFALSPLRRVGPARRRLRTVRTLAPVLHPVLAVKLADRDGLDGSRIKTTGIDAIPVRIGARHVKGLDAAHSAEQMLGDLRVERVLRQIIIPLQ